MALAPNYDAWPIPADLSPAGKKVAEAIVAFLTEKDSLWHGGGGAFYSPQQWRDRGEEYGLDSLLIICHDGGPDVFGDGFGGHGDPKLHIELVARLKSLGVFLEQCTTWYSAVFKI